MECNLTNIMFPGHFNPKTDKWCEYKERLLCSLDVAGFENQSLDKARSIFLSQCGKETYSLIASLLVPNRPTDVPFKDILAVLDKFYEPEVNEILEAGKFHSRKQTNNESVQDFVAAIGLLGARCNFVDLKRQLRDRLVLGVRDERLRRELLRTKTLTYETAVQLCLYHQAISPDMYPEMGSNVKPTPESADEAMDIGRVSAAQCGHFKQQHRQGKQCPFMKVRCFACKRLGHIASACNTKHKKQHQVMDEDAKSYQSKEDMMGVYACTDEHTSSMQTDTVSQSGKECPALISTNQVGYLSRCAEPVASEIHKVADVIWLDEQLKSCGLTMLKIALETNKDQIHQRVMFCIQHGWPNKNTDPALQPFWAQRKALSLNKGCLLWWNRVIISCNFSLFASYHK